MNKIAYIFPGQGDQIAGMGKDFCEAFPECDAIFEQASNATGLDLKEICFTENDKLNVTEYTQIAMLTASIAMLKAWETYGKKPDVCAGLSLGEYCALVCCGAMEFSDACSVVRQRGIFMQEAVPAGEGAMCAVLMLDEKRIEAICKEIGEVWIANYNCPGQIVISGKKEAVEQAAEKCKEAGAKRTVFLNVSGPFHSKLLEEAGQNLGRVLESVSINEHEIPYVTNVDASYIYGTDTVKELLKKQVSSSVRWQQSVENMLAQGVDTFVEIGPGKTLVAFVKKIKRDVNLYSISNIEDMKKVAKSMNI